MDPQGECLLTASWRSHPCNHRIECWITSVADTVYKVLPWTRLWGIMGRGGTRSTIALSHPTDQRSRDMGYGGIEPGTLLFIWLHSPSARSRSYNNRTTILHKDRDACGREPEWSEALEYQQDFPPVIVHARVIGLSRTSVQKVLSRCPHWILGGVQYVPSVVSSLRKIPPAS
ncbi:hypothetical protein K440DRAFT_621556 [Wilcoxina mikolae CBS 423.85]|nr:hypothetical protein K440DRAFT_621556 [Wilcoxina mikolae CBS 423.85]